MNAPTVIRVPVPGARSVVALLAHRGGSRGERPAEAGYAHLLEHLTSRRGNDRLSGRELAREAERLGADLGAETTFETVAFHVHARADAAERATRLLLTAMQPGPVTADALRAERAVVLQELGGYRDTRAFEAERLAGAHAYGEHPLGRPVLGRPDALRAATPERVDAFRRRTWLPAPRVLVLAGAAEVLDTIDTDGFDDPPAGGGAGRPTGAWEPGALPAPRGATGTGRLPGLPAEARTIHRLDGRLDLRTRCAVALLADLLGAGPDPVLARRLGLPAGVVRARAACHADVAVLQSAYLGARVQERLLDEVDEALREIAADGPPPRVLARVRGALAGRTTLSLDAPAAVAQLAARQALLWGEPPDRDAVIAGLESVTEDDIARVAGAMRSAGRFLLHAVPTTTTPPAAVPTPSTTTRAAPRRPAPTASRGPQSPVGATRT
ncbi:M16 family metallopeptidase [Patulibacter americanus]|uniref:M16 family metallopeptidase n=1 Tax=Patulibacter americanus TaxID=588672 RepID=UPI0003B45A07|nr:insulinase family protein [Patulibacter americanus]